MANFGFALDALKQGLRVHREGWNGKGMWLGLQRPDAHSKMSLPYIYMRTVSGDLVPWLASQTDMLSEDWLLLTSEEPRRTTPAPEAVQVLQGQGDPRPVSGRGHPAEGLSFERQELPANGAVARGDGKSVQIALREVRGPVGPNDDGVRFEADLSQADSVIAQQLTAAFDQANPQASVVERQHFLGGLPVRIAETKDQLQRMIGGAIEAAKRNPTAEVIRATVPLNGPSAHPSITG